MKQTYFLLALVLSLILYVGCSGGTGVTPDMPEVSADVDGTHFLSGFWQFSIDRTKGTVDVTDLRGGEIHLNAVKFLEPPVGINLKVENINFSGNTLDVDIVLRHPFLGLDQYSGFDVCGIMIMSGTETGFDDPDIVMTGAGDSRLMNPDGYTRWWNPVEFPLDDGTVFSYTDGALGTPNEIAGYSCTLNAYKYFADGLAEPLEPLSNLHVDSRGLFRAGMENRRHYTIEIVGETLEFNYAVDANWKQPVGTPPFNLPDDFPQDANRPEAWNISATETANTLWNDGVDSGGELSLAIDVYDWFNPELNSVKVESPGNFDAQVSSGPNGGGPGFSTYMVDITNATPSAGEIEFLISVASEQSGYGGLLPGKTVTSYFMRSASVADQGGVTGWAKHWGAGFQDRGYGAEVDSQGNIYVAGNYYYSVDFDPGEGEDIQPSSGNRDSFLTKFDSQGNHLWARTWGDSISFGGGATDIAIDSNDNIILSGYFYGTVDFDPGAGQDIHTYHTDGGQGDGGDAYVTVFDSDGNHMWAETWGGPSWLDDAALGVTVDSLGDIYVTGGALETVDFDPGVGEDIYVSQGGYRDVFISKFSADGIYQWSKHFGGPYDDYSFGMAVDLNGDVYVTGRYSQNCDFDPGDGEDWRNGADDGFVFLVKYDSDGNYIRVKTFGGQDGFRIAIDGSNNVWISGGFGGTSQFDPDGGTAEIDANGTRDAYLNVFDQDGNWLKVLTWDSIAIGDTTSGYIGYFVKIDDAGDIYAGGHFTQTADLDPDPGELDEYESNGNRDAYVTKLAPDGSHIWSRTYGGESVEDVGGLAVDSSTGRVYATGWFAETVDFWPGPEVDEHEAYGSVDAYLLRLNSNGSW